jgi:hypothetical protein
MKGQGIAREAGGKERQGIDLQATVPDKTNKILKRKFSLKTCLTGY